MSILHSAASKLPKRPACTCTLAAATIAALLASACNVSASDANGPIFDHQQPAIYNFRPADLPPPYATPAANNGQQVIPRPDGKLLHVPPGFSIAEWATGLDNPRWIEVAPNDDVFVADSHPNRVDVLRASPSGGPPTSTHFATDLHQPFGIAFYPNGPNPKYIYIANTDSVVRWPYHNGQLNVDGPGQKIVDLPGGGYNQHWTRTIVVSPDNKKLYIAVGSRENVGEEEQPRASIFTCNPDGTDQHSFATGLRNAVGLSFNPVSGSLWAAVNERDNLGDKLVPDYVTSVKPGGFYGWPYYYIGNHHDPRMPDKPELGSRAIVPDVLLEPHCAALSIEWDNYHGFPGNYYHNGFVAMHGSWNRSDPSGYKIVRLMMNANGTAKGGYQDFVWGWNLHDGQVWGRPVSVAFLHDGSMLISDDGAGKIWRVRYTGGKL